MKAKLRKEKYFSKYKKKHEQKLLREGLESIKNGEFIGSPVLKSFNPDLSKAIQTPKDAACNILTFPDSYIKNLQKLGFYK